MEQNLSDADSFLATYTLLIVYGTQNVITVFTTARYLFHS